MDTGRVGACHKLENKRRKFLIVINDVVKNKYQVYSEYLSHSHTEADHKFEKSQMFVRRALVRQKVLQKCMKMRRQNVDPHNVFGRYGGKPIESFGRDIESYIGYNHPKMRRQRYLQKLMDESLEKGAILKDNVATDRVANWMERSYTKYKLQKAKREKTVLEPIPEKNKQSTRDQRLRLPQLPKLPAPSKAFYTGTTSDVEISNSGEADILKLTEDVGKIKFTRDSPKPEADSKPTARMRATLVLPPIQSTKAMVRA